MILNSENPVGTICLRIGIFHPALDRCGGAEVVGVLAANALAEHGYDVSILTRKAIDQSQIKEKVGVPLASSIKVMTSPTIFEAYGTFYLYESAVKSLIMKSNCDVLFDTYTSCVFPWTNVSYIHFPYLNSYRYSQKFPYLKTPRFKEGISLPYIFFEEKLENYTGKLILTNSFFTAKAIKESLKIDSKVLYPPVPAAFFNKDSTNLIVPREDIVVSVARFGLGKGVELIPKIASLTNKNLHFIMIGLAHDQSVVQSVKALIKKLELQDRVTIMTDASRQTVKSMLAKAKVYLHTTQMEHFGISIAEAMVMGCIPIVHNSGGTPEFVPDKYRYNNLPEAALKIEAALNEWSLEKENEMKKISERFSEKNFSENLVKMFSEYYTP